MTASSAATPSSSTCMPLENVAWADDLNGSRVLAELKDAATDGLSIRLTTFSYIDQNPNGADFTLGTVTRDLRRGSASVTAYVSNPGLVAISGSGVKKRNVEKTVAVPGPVPFQIASAGSFKRRLERKGKVTIIPTVTFYPTGGEPASKSLTVKLRKRRSLQPV